MDKFGSTMTISLFVPSLNMHSAPRDTEPCRLNEHAFGHPLLTQVELAVYGTEMKSDPQKQVRLKAVFCV